MMNLLPAWRLATSADGHERIFIERLDKITRWARQIAGGNAALAEDLAQDAFLHFTTARPPLEEISNVDKYLYVVLTNLFRSHLAAVSRRSSVPLDPLAHESAMHTWRAVNPERRLTLRQELHRICIFVCDRKETSKGASAFLLHFFHGLSVSEVSLVMQTSRAAVDERLSVLRKEARRHREQRTAVLVKSCSDETELMAELQSIIAKACRGDCFSAEEAKRSYASDATELARDRLAHLASCAKCLRLVAQILNFPPDAGSPPAGSGTRNRLSRWKDKRAELLSTEPSELRLLVNGCLLATERVHQPTNYFCVCIALREPLDFLEIWNGEKNRLLFFPGISAPPEGRYQQRASIDLNAGLLELTLRFEEPWPTVSVCYMVAPAESMVKTPEQNRTQVINTPLLRNTRKTVAADMEARTTPQPGCALGAPPEQPRSSFVAWWRAAAPFALQRNKITFHRRLSWPFSLPMLTSALALVLIAVLLFVQTRETTLDASGLLDKAAKWEEGATTTHAPVLHRRFSLVKQKKGMPAERTFVDVWRQPRTDAKLSRWTGGSGHLLAEARRAVARPSSPIHLEAGNIWQFEPSAEDFTAGAGRMDHATVSKTADRLTIQTGFAELILDRATDRPIEEKFSLGNSVYVFSEILTETTPLAGSPLLSSVPEAHSTGIGIRTAKGTLHTKPPFGSPNFLVDERELRVRQQLHALELATAASITTHKNTVEVQFSPSSPEQERTVRSAVDKISGVSVSILDARAAVLQATTTGAPGAATPANPKLAEPVAEKWLRPILLTESKVRVEEEHRLQTAHHLVSLVAELRLLAQRYPPAVESHLSSEADSILRAMVDDLRKRIGQDLHDEQSAIAPLLRNVSDSSHSPTLPDPCQRWQAEAIHAADLLWENERLIEQFYAPAAPNGATIRDTELPVRLRSLTDTLVSVVERTDMNVDERRAVCPESLEHLPLKH